MRKDLLKRFAAFMLIVCCCTSIMAQIPAGYYDSLKGKKGAALKNAVHDIIKDANVLNYGSGNRSTWWGFWLTDRTSDGRYIDRYSPESAWVKSSSQGKAGDGMNIEHSFPKSWWGGSKNQAYCDLYNLMPCESGINTSKSNYVMGKTTDTSIADNGATKIGGSSWGVTVWEPADEWKGDFARGYMYMATCYQTLSWVKTGTNILESNDYPTLKKKASDLYIQWAKADKPTELEITRNNAVSKIQGNRNPFVDFPNLMDYIWGDSVDTAFDPTTTVCTSKYTGDDTPVGPGDTEVTIAKWDFTSNDCGFTVEDVVNPFTNVWQNTTTYGWKATGYSGKANAADSYLVSPEIDLTAYKSASMSISQSMNWLNNGNRSDFADVEIRCGGKATSVADRMTWPTGSNWVFIESGNVPLNDFVGNKIQVAFHYKSTSEIAPTWEIKLMNLTAKKTEPTDGISNALQPSDSAPQTFYTLDGQRLDNITGYSGIVIVKQGNKTWKIAK